jgi:gamma-glutamyltranspeptidase / glutathione hydrolase
MLPSIDLPYPSKRPPVFAHNVIATSQPLAAQAGLHMLRIGGNAVDAAIASAIALTVVEPTSNGIGGDAFAIVWDGKALHGLNGSGRAPRLLSRDLFRGMKSMPTTGWATVTVPGAVDAWASLSGRFGRLSFATLFGPAIDYAENGFPVSPIVAGQWWLAAQKFTDFESFKTTFLPNGRPPGAGEWFRCPDQAQTLREIAATKGQSFYRGALAQRIVAYAARDGGYLREDDLALHRSEWVETLSKPYHGITLHELPPNGQGLAALLALGILSHLDIRRHRVDSPESIHLQVEAMKIAFAEARTHLGDPLSMSMDAKGFLDEDYLAKRAAQVDPMRACRPKATPSPDKGTVYLTAADQEGMMVSFIQSNYMGFGSGIVVPGTGISLQNRGTCFSLKKGHPNMVAGGQRPFHTIMPGFVTRDSEPLMSFGVMGGHMQPQGHVQMITRIFDYGQNPQAASDGPRWFVSEDFGLALEPGFDPGVTKALRKKGHRLLKGLAEAAFGGAQIIMKLDKGYCAASDHRKDGQAVGF